MGGDRGPTDTKPRIVMALRSTRYVNIPRPTLIAGHQVNAVNTNGTNETSLELDSHADTCCVGKDALVIYDFDTPVEVYGYDQTQGAQHFRTVSAVMEYVHTTGQRYHLVVHQAIEIPHLQHHLLCQMQCRMNGVEINDKPKFLTKNPTADSHAIIVQDPAQPGPDKCKFATLCLPLCLRGVTSYLPMTKSPFQNLES